MSGWNLPDGCTDQMVDEAFGCKRDSSDLSNNVRTLLEKARVSQRTIDLIMDEITEWEDDEREPDPDDERDSRADYLYERDR